MMKKQIIIAGVLLISLLILLGIGVYFSYPNQSLEGEQIYCTLDAKICPDGSAVGRIPPKCEFSPCPSI
jgi:hypothetical protein